MSDDNNDDAEFWDSLRHLSMGGMGEEDQVAMALELSTKEAGALDGDVSMRNDSRMRDRSESTHINNFDFTVIPRGVRQDALSIPTGILESTVSPMNEPKQHSQDTFLSGSDGRTTSLHILHGSNENFIEGDDDVNKNPSSESRSKASNRCSLIEIADDLEYDQFRPIAGAEIRDDDMSRSSDFTDDSDDSVDSQVLPFFCSIEAFFRIKVRNGEVHQEVTGWSMDASARGLLSMSGAFLLAAILHLATEAAGCEGPTDTCTPTVYGFRPSSLLTISNAIAGFTTALFMPLIGALIDYSQYRKEIGAFSAFLVVMITGVSSAISNKTWFAILILESIAWSIMMIHSTIALAYLPEISKEHNELATYTTQFNFRQFLFSATFVGVMSFISYFVQSSTVTARVSQMVSCLLSAVLFGCAWGYLFPKRPPRRLGSEKNILTAGFKQILSTTKTIFSRYLGLKWFLMALLWSPDASTGVFLTISVTFMVDFLEMNTTEIGLVNLTLLLANIPGSWISKYLCQRYNALRSFQMCLIWFVINIGLCSACLTGPERQHYIFIFAVTWGIAFGWLYPSQTVLYCTLSPPDQQTEMMGLFTFYGQVLGWLPSIIFSVLNERGVNMRLGLASLCIFFLIAFVCTLFMGSYENAVREVHITTAHVQAVDESLNSSHGEDSKYEIAVINCIEEKKLGGLGKFGVSRTKDLISGGHQSTSGQRLSKELPT